MKVLHIVSNFGQGGAQKYVLNLMKYQILQGLDVCAVAMFFKGVLWQDVAGLRVPLWCMRMRNALDIKGLWRFHTFLKSHNFDIIHVHAVHPAIGIMINRMNSKNIYSEHSGGLLSGQWIPTLVYRYFNSAYCRFIAISKETAKAMEHFGPEIGRKTEVVYNGINLQEIDSADPEGTPSIPLCFINAGYRVGIVARLVPLKGLNTFLEVAKRLLDDEKNMVFAIIGDGYLRDKLEKKAMELGIADKIIFFGYRPDAIQVMKYFDVFLLTSNFEGFGLVIIESMAAMVPVVALHKKGAVREIIDHYHDGIIVDNGTVDQLAEAVTTLIHDRKLREKIIMNGRKKVENRFVFRKNAEKILTIYGSCRDEFES
ncbi:MAG: glycosyltransferase family 1 protein [Desulfobacteraceae bacterium]|nr:MAG: glycosyltransferase family 1 protein [Desulfobacteraceae bacterium]